LEPCTSSEAIFEYGGALAHAIQRFKYEGRVELAHPLGSLLARGALPWRQSVDVVVPVPLHWRRRWDRGYDQSALLAGRVGRVLELPVGWRMLRRTRHTPRQADLSRSERLRNVQGAFVAGSACAGLRILLLDDVRTTGATSFEAAAALRRAGAAEIRALALAARVHGPSA